LKNVNDDMAAPAGKSALLLGATGATGKKLLGELLANHEWTRVGEYGRRVSALPASTTGKLEQKAIDFENLDAAGLKDGRWDVVFVTLGTTRAQAGSAANFEKIDREYVVNACKAAKTDDPAHEQRVVYLSSGGANPSSPFLYTKSKGLTELGLARLGYADTIIFRPGFLKNAERPDKRLAETVLGAISGVMARVSSSVVIEVPTLAKAIMNAGALGSSRLPDAVGACKAGPPDAPFTIIDNKGAGILGRAQ
jgi:oxidoreductase